jgi:hypothetical protein
VARANVWADSAWTGSLWSNQQLTSGHGQDQRRSADTTRGVDD